MVFRLVWKSSKTDEQVRIYGDRKSIRDTLAILLIHPQRALNLKVEAILNGGEGGREEQVRDVTQEFALEHIYEVLNRN